MGLTHYYFHKMNKKYRLWIFGTFKNVDFFKIIHRIYNILFSGYRISDVNIFKHSGIIENLPQINKFKIWFQTGEDNSQFPRIAKAIFQIIKVLGGRKITYFKLKSFIPNLNLPVTSPEKVCHKDICQVI